jgi:UDP-N-acetylglucosamine:LPS N-acetylglucosamine transferase
MTTLMVSSPGGHIAELVALAPRLTGADEDYVWVTPRIGPTESLLAGKQVVWTEQVEARDLRAAAAQVPRAVSLLRKLRPVAVVSNGAALSVPYLLTAAAMRIPAHYIECSTRIGSPSLSGRILSALPGIEMYTQFTEAVTRRWIFRGSVFDGFTCTDDGPRAVQRVVVTLGTMPNSFRRAIERLIEILPQNASVLWQTGDTPVDGLPIEARPYLPAAELEQAMREADVVIGHCGVGTAHSALEAGRLPVLLPRDPARGEVLDRHQFDLAGNLERRGLARVYDASSLTLDDLEAAAGITVRATDPGPFQLTVKAGRTMHQEARHARGGD